MIINNNKINVLISEEQLQNRINELGKQISEEYEGKEIVIICILKGSTYFTVDLTKKITNNLIIDFMKVSSYGNNKESSGKIKVELELSTDIKNKDVIIVEDIIDTGITLNYLCEYIKEKDPNSLKICTLLDKKERRVKNVEVDYVGFEIENKFVIGYGLDYAEYYRNLPYVGYIED